eukprot:TRINITY_DN6089_c0_g1_i2.p1 TRINITY_DN6089_c0_g1~~TRINITY_DN6089_c0_g1_i2.p1  ORF type:complete len:371 (+),score=97.14 TRINITY_DN6089_c0_g1_i2:70-1182(+)
MQAAARAEDDDLAVVRRVLQRLDAEPRAALAHPVPPGSCAFACATALEAVLARDPDYLPALFMLRTLCLVSPKLSTSKVPMHFARHEMTQQIYRITRESHRCLAEGNALAAELLETNSVEYSLHFAGLWAYWVREEHALAACIFRRLADAGNTSGMHNLGVSHAFGLGVPRDFSAAAALFRRAAEAGHTGALFNLAVCAKNGDGVPRDFAAAAAMFQRAAEAGDVAAVYCLARCYRSGDGVPRDDTRAAVLFSLAADAGDSEAQVALGLCYELGAGVTRDGARAAELYALAAGNDNTNALRNLGVCRMHGIGVDRDEAGCGKAAFNLAAMFLEGELVAKDARLAVKLLRRAVACGCDEGKHALEVLAAPE